jgi:hypothetical protein
MATTTNFGWETPDDTDLVKDGALAIRTLGSAIDTSLVDLKGGTTGQVLSKTSNTDMDFTWVTSDDANAIQNAIVDAKGDLITATAADTPARLAVGTNGHVLTADSTTATGLKWAAAAASSAATYQKVITDGTNRDTTSTSFTPINTSQYRITATPVSTFAIAILQAFVNTNGTQNYDWRINCGSGTTYEFVAKNGSYQGNVVPNAVVVGIITGLTAGTSYNFDWEHKTTSGTSGIIGDQSSTRPRMVVIC